MVESIAFQGQFFQPLQEITGNKEVAEYRGLIESMEKIISDTGMDLAFAKTQIKKKRMDNFEAGKSLDLKASVMARLTRTAITAYSCAISQGFERSVIPGTDCYQRRESVTSEVLRIGQFQRSS